METLSGAAHVYVVTVCATCARLSMHSSSSDRANKLTILHKTLHDVGQIQWPDWITLLLLMLAFDHFQHYRVQLADFGVREWLTSDTLKILRHAFHEPATRTPDHRDRTLCIDLDCLPIRLTTIRSMS